MKRLFSFVCVMMLTIAASAQITWNVKGGIGVATMWDVPDGSDMKTHLVSKAGVGIEYPFAANWSLMPSLEVAWKGEKSGSGANKETWDILYVQVPIVAAYRINLADAWNMTLKAGPYFAYAVNDKVDPDLGYDYDINKFDVGLDAGIDFEYHRFVFGVEAEMGFVKLIDGADPKNLAFYGTIGWKF